MLKQIFYIAVLSLCPMWAAAQQYVRSSEMEEDDGFRWIKVEDEAGRQGALYENGEVILPAQFDNIYYYQPNKGFFTNMEANHSEGFYSRTGKCIVPHARGYESIVLAKHAVTGYYFLVKKNGATGICDGKGSEIISPDRGYTGINPLDSQYGDYFSINTGDKYGVCDLAGNELIAPEYPNTLTRKGRMEFYTYDDHSRRYDAVARREPDTRNPFGENRVDDVDFYVDFGDGIAPYPQAPYLSMEEMSRAIAARKRNVGKTFTVVVPADDDSDTPTVDEAVMKDIVQTVRNDAKDEIRQSIGRKDYLDAYANLSALMKDDRFIPTDPDEQCEFVTLLADIKTGITGELMVAATGTDFNRYLLLSTVYMDIESLQRTLLLAAIGQGSQTAVAMLQVLNATSGGGSAPAQQPDSDYEPLLIQVDETCTLCRGKGTIRTQSVSGYGAGSPSYVEETCPSCRGKKTIRRLKNNPRR